MRPTSWEQQLIGRLLGPCRVTRLIDAGSMSSVFEGFHESLQIRLAIKVFPKREGTKAKALMRFYQEARQAARLDHPNIVRVLGVDSEAEFHYLMMQYVDGDTLSQILAREKQIAPPRVVEWLLQTLAGLAYAHANACIHRDIKPDNLMLNREGVLKITDFGLAREIGITAAPADPGASPEKPTKDTSPEPGKKTKTVPGQMLGTPFYMPQEQWENAAEIDHRADLYALGITAYQLLSGRLPFSGTNPVQILGNIIKGHYTPLGELAPAVPPTLAAIVARLMHADKDQRYQSADEATADVRAWRDGRTEVAATVSTGPTARPGDMWLHYRLATFQGASSTAELWQAENTSTGETVLVKFLRDPRAADRLAECQDLIRRIYGLNKHAGVLKLRDVFARHRPPFVVFEDVPNALTLRDELAERGPLAELDAVNLMMAVADVLGTAHDAGLIHGDLRDANLLVTHDGPAVGAKVFNFGLLTDLDAHPLALRLITPTPPTAVKSDLRGTQTASSSASSSSASLSLDVVDWLPPEITAGNPPTAASDIYGLGLIGLVALTGKRPSRNLARQIDGAPASAEMRELLHQMIDDDPTARPATAKDVLRELTQLKLMGVLGFAPPTSDTTRSKQPSPPPAPAAALPANVPTTSGRLPAPPAVPRGHTRREEPPPVPPAALPTARGSSSGSSAALPVPPSPSTPAARPAPVGPPPPSAPSGGGHSAVPAPSPSSRSRQHRSPSAPAPPPSSDSRRASASDSSESHPPYFGSDTEHD